jgi:hypothetical protein
VNSTTKSNGESPFKQQQQQQQQQKGQTNTSNKIVQNSSGSTKNGKENRSKLANITKLLGSKHIRTASSLENLDKLEISHPKAGANRNSSISSASSSPNPVYIKNKSNSNLADFNRNSTESSHLGIFLLF